MAVWTATQNGTWNVDAGNSASPWHGGSNPTSGYPGSTAAGDQVALASYTVQLTNSPAYPLQSLTATSGSVNVAMSSSTGNLALSAGLVVGASGAPSNPLLNVSGTGYTFTLTGSLVGGSSTTGSKALGVGSGNAVVNGSVSGGSGSVGSNYGAYLSGGTLTVNNGTIQGAVNTTGQAIYNMNGTMTVSGCVLVFPSSSTAGQPIYGSYTWVETAISGVQIAGGTVFRPQANYSDPGAAAVLAGQTYQYAGSTVTGTLAMVSDASVQADVATALNTAIAGTPAAGSVAALLQGAATVAGQTSILGAVNGITTNTVRSRVITGSQFIRPATGTNSYTILLQLFNEAGQPEDPDNSAVSIAAGGAALGSDRNALLGGLSGGNMTRQAIGNYTATLAVAGLDQAAPLPTGDTYFSFNWNKTELVGGTSTAVAMNAAAAVPVVDAVMEATLANIITAVGAIPTNTLSSSDARLANLDAAVSSRLATTGYTPPPTATEVAQAVLQTDLSTVEDAAAADSLCTVCLASLHSSVAGTTWTIRKTDGTTMVAKTVAVSAGAEPIVGVT